MTGGIVTLLVSVPAGTFVCRLNDDDPTRPEPPLLSLAVHGTITSVDCHAGAGAVHFTVGRVKSTLMVNVGVALLTFKPLLVTSVSTMLELSVAAYVITV